MSAAALSASGPRDQAAGALHRGDADQGARGARDRPPVDVRLDHRHDPQPRLRLQEGHRAGAGLAGVLGDPAAGGALPAAGRPTSSPRGMEDVLDEIAAGRKDRVSELQRVLLRLRRACRACTPLVNELGDIDARELATFPIGGPDSGHRPAGRPLRPLPRRTRRRRQPRGQAGQRARGPAARRAHPREGAGAARQPGRRGDRARRAPRDRAAGRGQERPLRPVRHRGAARGRAQERQAAHRLAVQVDVAGHDHPRRRGEAAVAAAGGRRPTRRAARRSPRRTAATGRT